MSKLIIRMSKLIIFFNLYINSVKFITIIEFIAKCSLQQGPSGPLAQQPLDGSSVV